MAVQVLGSSGALLSSTYPNPFNSDLNLELGQDVAGGLNATLADALGHRVFSTTSLSAKRQFTLQRPASLAPGSCVLTVRGNGQQSSRQVIKQWRAKAVSWRLWLVLS